MNKISNDELDEFIAIHFNLCPSNPSTDLNQAMKCVEATHHSFTLSLRAGSYIGSFRHVRARDKNPARAVCLTIEAFVRAQDV